MGFDGYNALVWMFVIPWDSKNPSKSIVPIICYVLRFKTHDLSQLLFSIWSFEGVFFSCFFDIRKKQNCKDVRIVRTFFESQDLTKLHFWSTVLSPWKKHELSFRSNLKFKMFQRVWFSSISGLLDIIQKWIRMIVSRKSVALRGSSAIPSALAA